MRVRELIDWLTKHGDPEDEVMVRLTSNGRMGVVTRVESDDPVVIVANTCVRD